MDMGSVDNLEIHHWGIFYVSLAKKTTSFALYRTAIRQRCISSRLFAREVRCSTAYLTSSYDRYLFFLLWLSPILFNYLFTISLQDMFYVALNMNSYHKKSIFISLLSVVSNWWPLSGKKCRKVRFIHASAPPTDSGRYKPLWLFAHVIELLFGPPSFVRKVCFNLWWGTTWWTISNRHTAYV